MIRRARAFGYPPPVPIPVPVLPRTHPQEHRIASSRQPTIAWSSFSPPPLRRPAPLLETAVALPAVRAAAILGQRQPSQRQRPIACCCCPTLLLPLLLLLLLLPPTRLLSRTKQLKNAWLLRRRIRGVPGTRKTLGNRAAAARACPRWHHLQPRPRPHLLLLILLLLLWTKRPSSWPT